MSLQLRFGQFYIVTFKSGEGFVEKSLAGNLHLNRLPSYICQFICTGVTWQQLRCVQGGGLGPTEFPPAVATITHMPTLFGRFFDFCPTSPLLSDFPTTQLPIWTTTCRYEYRSIKVPTWVVSSNKRLINTHTGHIATLNSTLCLLPGRCLWKTITCLLSTLRNLRTWVDICE